ncbi:MAG TPA: hypothetical protein VHM70_25885 [Polyangiaceae bacterium]|jgi:Zn-finger nucleic acid-binding protein|nr:hypothetical protein [Polyangiaceae bacterium]
MSANASLVRCGECGGPNAAGTRHCDFCRAPIATLRCAHCYQLNTPASDFCVGCGEVLGLVPFESPHELPCPACGGECTSLDGEPGLLLDCSQCAGQFVEHSLLGALLERRRRYLRAVQPQRRAMQLEEQIRYRRCPLCSELMLRRNFGRTSGIIVDWCAAHGVWFDVGELSSVLGFVEAGGLAHARGMELGIRAPLTVEDERKRAAAIARSLDTKRPLAASTPSATAAQSALEIAKETLESSVNLLDAIARWFTPL